MVVVSDGVYMGRQKVTRLGDANSRIGYRHPGLNRRDGSANVAFADGHVEAIAGNRFPTALENTDGRSVYANPAILTP
jgi:prepilin-type processing-associated H-X9-DG protein